MDADISLSGGTGVLPVYVPTNEDEVFGEVQPGFRRYEDIRNIAEGGVGLVNRAYDPVLGRVIAVKELRDRYCRDTELRLRFLRDLEERREGIGEGARRLLASDSPLGRDVIGLLASGLEVDPRYARAVDADTEEQERVTALVNGFRLRGHLNADLDPLGLAVPERDELSLERFGLADTDPEKRFATGNFAGGGMLPLREIVSRLRDTYARTIGVEFRNIEEAEIRAWLQDQMEPMSNRIDLDVAQQERMAALAIIGLSSVG